MELREELKMGFWAWLSRAWMLGPYVSFEMFNELGRGAMDLGRLFDAVGVLDVEEIGQRLAPLKVGRTEHVLAGNHRVHCSEAASTVGIEAGARSVGEAGIGGTVVDVAGIPQKTEPRIAVRKAHA